MLQDYVRVVVTPGEIVSGIILGIVAIPIIFMLVFYFLKSFLESLLPSNWDMKPPPYNPDHPKENPYNKLLD